MSGRRSTVVVEDHVAAQALLFQPGYGDGLPSIPPTADLVDAMVDRGGRPAERPLGAVEGRPEGITVEQAAVCAVLAGALPEHFPVILATWDAVFDPRLNAGAVLGSSGGTALTAVVSGPYATTIGMNAGHNLFGPGNRANATIGRAVRLGLMNALGYRPGLLDGSAFGSQARYTAHFAEADPEPPWEPLRVRLGHGIDDTTVTVAVTDAPRQVLHSSTARPENIMAMLRTCMRDLSHCGAGEGIPYLVVLGPEHAGVLQQAGFTPDAIADELASATRVTEAELDRAGAPRRSPEERTPWHVAPDDDGTLPMAHAADITVVTAGGTGAGWSQVIFGYAPRAVSVPVTRKVEVPA